MKLNLLAILKDDTLRRIVTNGDLQDEVSNYFLELKNIFDKNKTEIIFDGRYIVDDDEIFIINDFQISDDIINAIKNPLIVDVLNLKKEINEIKSLLCGKMDNKNDKENFIIFQSFDKRKILDKKFALINTKDTYTKINDPGIVISDRIDIIYRDFKIYFYSYHNSRKVFDLTQYYNEATNNDLETFSKNDLFIFDDSKWFIENSDSVIRKKVALLQKNEVLSKTSLKDIQEQAKDFEITLNIKENKLHFPKDKKTVKEIIRFLDKDYFIAPLTGRKCMTNSKRYLS